jgi:chaperonin GroEL
VHLWWLVQSGFLVKYGNRYLLIDPYLSDSLTKKYAATDKPHARLTERVIDPARLDFVDVVTSSHNHTDHLDAQTLIPLMKANQAMRIVTPAANRQFAAERLGVDPTTILAADEGKTITVAAVKSPFFGDRRKAFVQDLAIVTGAEVVSGEVGLKLSDVGLEVLGKARRVTVTKDDTTIVDGGGSAEAVADRAAQLRQDIETTDSDWDREKLQERLAKLAGGVAVIKVGAATEIEAKERKHRIEDAVHATKAAVAEGIIAGGGAALVHASAELSALEAQLTGDEATGVAIVRRALSAPAFWIAANGGEEGAVVVNKIAELPVGQGYDANTGEYVDMVKAGIIDPVKVTKSAVSNAASIAGMVLTTASTVVEIPQDAPEEAAGHHGHSH